MVKPTRPNLRGEKWELTDGRVVTLLGRIGIDMFRRGIFRVINDRGLLESVNQGSFKTLLLPKSKEPESDLADEVIDKENR